MRVRKGKISIISLIIVSALTVLLVFLELNSKTYVEAQHYQEKIAAAQFTNECFRTVKAALNSTEIAIDRINDPNETGLIGQQYSLITTERGDLTAKLTSTNPNFAALIVQYVKAARVQKNDTIAVSFTGSFPALNLAVLSVLKTLELEPIIITSVSSSMWGANRPAFTYLDMERTLKDHGLIAFGTRAASIGGEDDVGRGLSPQGREMIISAITRNGVELLEGTRLEETISQRKALYAGPVKLFINVGGGAAALLGTDAPSGFIKPRQIKAGKGLIAQFSQAGIPVINLADVNALAQKHNLPVAPIPVPRIGKGSLYFEYRYSVGQAILYLIILCIVLVVFLKFDVEYYFRRK
jgi:poly-gamma-glutamate system protein